MGCREPEGGQCMKASTLQTDACLLWRRKEPYTVGHGWPLNLEKARKQIPPPPHPTSRVSTRNEGLLPSTPC